MPESESTHEKLSEAGHKGGEVRGREEHEAAEKRHREDKK
jgi:hypothetical protein